MTILETAIRFKGNNLCEVQFYSSKENISDLDRNFLSKTIGVLVKSDFGDKIHKFSMGKNKILMKLKNLELVDEDTKEKSNNPLVIYCIAEKKANEKPINKCMDDSLTQFLEQFSIKEIITKKSSKFNSFNEQLKKIFQKIALKPEDRFKSILF